MFQMPPPNAERCGVKLRERWLAHLGMTEAQLASKRITKPEVCWTHFPEAFFKSDERQRKAMTNETPNADGKPRRRRLRFAVFETHLHQPEDLIKEGKHAGYAIPVPCVKFEERTLDNPELRRGAPDHTVVDLDDQALSRMGKPPPSKIPRLLENHGVDPLIDSHSALEQTNASLATDTNPSGEFGTRMQVLRRELATLSASELEARTTARLKETLDLTLSNNRAMQTSYQGLLHTIREPSDKVNEMKTGDIASHANAMRSLYFSTVHQLQIDILHLHQLAQSRQQNDVAPSHDAPPLPQQPPP
ncbi:Hypothetical Protein FCC1311_101272 [Hondaea fermentalgiana]|uniref:THAP-type domain-containing protein n=1 Tax=Hondaea fermentalgiana TaxID=2315210 RepID=A0A2R5H0R1_9STRA|nr:Hypothetical Protein FCC1311_101272 [Hondaea fermentalgiana]|eukprot:GBG33904.1 Hypothetical Protein FCC1311_101272 [Hondaea fermentalgiana]